MAEPVTSGDNGLPCADKLVFENSDSAPAAAATLKWRRGTKLKVYQCRHCGLWHLSTSSGDE